MEALVGQMSTGIVSVKLDLEHKLEYGLNTSYTSKNFELRESVATATFKQMSDQRSMLGLESLNSS